MNARSVAVGVYLFENAPRLQDVGVKIYNVLSSAPRALCNNEFYFIFHDAMKNDICFLLKILSQRPKEDPFLKETSLGRLIDDYLLDRWQTFADRKILLGTLLGKDIIYLMKNEQVKIGRSCRSRDTSYRYVHSYQVMPTALHILQSNEAAIQDFFLIKRKRLKRSGGVCTKITGGITISIDELFAPILADLKQLEQSKETEYSKELQNADVKANAKIEVKQE